MTKNEFYVQFLAELDRSLVVDDKTRQYWIMNYKTLPLSALELFYAQLVKTDKNIDKMVAVGIDAHPELGEKIVQKGKESKKKAFKYFEQQEVQQENPEDYLQKSLT